MNEHNITYYDTSYHLEVLRQILNLGIANKGLEEIGEEVHLHIFIPVSDTQESDYDTLMSDITLLCEAETLVPSMLTVEKQQ